MKRVVLKSKSCKREQTAESVPCKLNNVKTNYNTLDNYELFKFRVNEFKPTKILE